mmetsp:Transcript_29326/g.35723  ORF Transcript_29326/g.35723 Transcript_29326/m.35723 type:complete len:612 (-) Transcript_29326:64-1899(-)
MGKVAKKPLIPPKMMSENDAEERTLNNDDDDDEPNPITGERLGDAGGNTSTTDQLPPYSHQESVPPFSPQKTSGLFGASSNLVNSIVGAGIIGIPYALRQSGLIAGVILLAMVSYFTDKSLRIIVEAAKFHPQLRHLNVTTFEDLMFYPFGRAGTMFILFNMFVMAYGAMVAYLLIIKDTVPTIIGLGDAMEGGIEREVVLIVTSLLVMVPLSMQRDMASLAFTSLLSVSADAVLVGFVMFYSPVKETVEANGGIWEVLKADSVNPTIFIGLGILSTAMACQHSAFIVNGSLHNNTRIRWAIVTGTSLSISCFLCMILGVSGYLGFLDETQGDVLNNFQPGSVAANTARALLAITMFFTYPMESFVGRHVLVALIHGGDMDGDNVEHSGCLDRCMLNRRERMTLGLYVLALLPALIFDDLGPVLSITGSLGGSCISYIAPGMVYLGVNGDAFLSYAYDKLQAKSVTDTTIELPVAGSGGQMMQASSRPTRDNNLELPVEGSQVDIFTSPANDTYKPLWWYLFGYPLWCSIALCGSNGMKMRLGDSETQANFTQIQASGAEGNAADEQGDIVYPKGSDFFLAIFFIVFGFIAAVLGLASNIYVQLQNVGVIS